VKARRRPAKYSSISARRARRCSFSPGTSGRRSRRFRIASCVSSMRRSVNSNRQTPEPVAAATIGPSGVRSHASRRTRLAAAPRRLSEVAAEGFAKAAQRLVARVEGRRIEVRALAQPRERPAEAARAAAGVERKAVGLLEMAACRSGVMPSDRNCAVASGVPYYISNSVVIVGDDGVAVVDSGAGTNEARVLFAAIRTVTALPVRYVIDTHFHFDHAFGSEAFPGALIVGHQATREMLARTRSRSGRPRGSWPGCRRRSRRRAPTARRRPIRKSAPSRRSGWRPWRLTRRSWRPYA